jgi:tRNA-Thr(GGU) m(6)t(6)A37 methyltransferase TsaA
MCEKSRCRDLCGDYSIRASGAEMVEKQVNLQLIGVLRTPHQQLDQMPIQPSGARNVEGVAELFPEYVEGLADLSGFSHAILLYHLHKTTGHRLTVKPFMDTVEHGIFATRSPCRPAAIGLSIVRVRTVDSGRLIFTGADMLDGSPLIDIKPFFASVDNQPDAVSGWLDAQEKGLPEIRRSDRRFCS